MLGRLKREGCNLLVTGEVPCAVSDAATRRLLGAPYEDRSRVLALTGPKPTRAHRRLPGGCRPGDPDVRVIEFHSHTRSAAATRPAGTRVERAGPSLVDLQVAIEGAIEEMDARADGLEPAELRFSLDSLRLLVEECGSDDVREFLAAVTAAVEGVAGMGHYHLSVADDADLAGELSPLFDARIELRKRETVGPEQRWHVPRLDLSTNWVGL